ncbi:MAG: hypothetical protein MJZ16_12855 [Bacteroidales bacterium]|nr:hypothetical protein [Bacteroidales bacterium]
MEKKIIKTNEEEMKYVSPKTKLFEFTPTNLICTSPGSDTDPEEEEFGD